MTRPDLRPVEDLRCHFCQEARGDLHQSPTDPGMWWCPPGDVECTFRARRRLGLPLVVALEAKARELEQLGWQAAAPLVSQAEQTRYRIAAILASDPPARSAEYRAHLGSASWGAFCTEQRLTARHCCEDCGRVVTDLTVHHLSYERLGRDLPADVVVLCGICHGRWDEARRAFYREREYSRVVAVDQVYGDLLTDGVRDRIAERLAWAARTSNGACGGRRKEHNDEKKLAELTERLEELADTARYLADDLDPVCAPRDELRDLLLLEFSPDIGTHGKRLWLETVIDDLIRLTSRDHPDTAKELADGLRSVVMGHGDCIDCGADTYAIGEYYMLENAVWLEANPGEEGMLCIGCVETRLGRRLEPADFTNIEMNREAHLSARLRSRVHGIAEAPAA